jgi:hypothetical protein
VNPFIPYLIEMPLWLRFPIVALLIYVATKLIVHGIRINGRTLYWSWKPRKPRA